MFYKPKHSTFGSSSGESQCAAIADPSSLRESGMKAWHILSCIQGFLKGSQQMTVWLSPVLLNMSSSVWLSMALHIDHCLCLTASLRYHLLPQTHPPTGDNSPVFIVVPELGNSHLNLIVPHIPTQETNMTSNSSHFSFILPPASGNFYFFVSNCLFWSCYINGIRWLVVSCNRPLSLRRMF